MKNLSNWSLILGKKGLMRVSNLLANTYIKEGKNITADKVNKVLAFSDIKITQNMLDKILSRPRIKFSNLDSDTIRSPKFLESIGTIRGKLQVPGVYIWRHLSSNDMYVGSSSMLARRLIGYFNNTHKNTGKLIPLIKKEGISAFNLEVIPLTEDYVINQELSLEQYFLLHSKFNLNVIKVVNDFSGARSKPLYMYTKDFAELIYSSHIQEDFIFKLRIHHTIFTKSLNTGAIYLGKYVFTDKPVIGAKESNMSEEEINILLDKDKLEENNIKGISRKILIKNINNNEVKSFDSISSCLVYLNSIAPSNKSTLYRYIKSQKPYNGFICQWQSEPISLVKDKAIEVNVTNILNGDTVNYTSFRKAALSFAPENITTGSTLKALAEKGELFKGKYKITIISKDNK